MLQTSHSPNSLTAMPAARSGSAKAAAPATNAAGELFGPVLQQQSHARESAPAVPADKPPKTGNSSQKTVEQPAEPGTDAHNINAGSGRESARERTGGITGESPGESPGKSTGENAGVDTKNPTADLAAGHPAKFDDASAQAAPAARTDTIVLEHMLQQGKVMPAGGNGLPVADNSMRQAQGYKLTASPANSAAVDTEATPTKVTGFNFFSDRYAEDSLLSRSALRGNDTQAGHESADTDTNMPAAFAAASPKASSQPQGFDLSGAMLALAISDAASADSASESSSLLIAPATLASADKLSAARPVLTPPATSTSFQIDSRPGSPDWNHQVGDKIRWMGRADIAFAEMKLNPAELGSIEIKVFTEDQQTRVSFITSNAATRDIIEATLPKLRELLQNSGLQLEHSDISHRNDSGKHAQREDSVSKDAFFNEPDALSGQILVSPRQGLGQIDHYV